MHMHLYTLLKVYYQSILLYSNMLNKLNVMTRCFSKNGTRRCTSGSRVPTSLITMMQEQLVTFTDLDTGLQ